MVIPSIIRNGLGQTLSSNLSVQRNVAQPGSACVLGTQGRRFDSCHSDHFMIKLKSLLLEAETNLKAGWRFPLGDGYVLKYEGDGMFIVYDSERHKAMRMMIHTMNSIPSVGHVRIRPKYRGQGLFRRSLLVLKDKFGHVRSNRLGHTSDEAEKAWRAVGAEENPPGLGDSKFKLDDVIREGIGFKSGEKIPISGEGGYVLEYRGYGYFIVRDSQDRSAMTMLVKSYKGIPFVRHVSIKGEKDENGRYSGHRGKGLFRRTLLILKNRYGDIRSDASGHTSPEARDAWESMPGVEKLWKPGKTPDPKHGKSRFKLDEITKFDVGDAIPLDDRYVLKNVGNSEFRGYDLQGNEVMYLRINQRLNAANPSIEYVEIQPLHRGQRLYDKALLVLKRVFGNIRSDRAGDTEPEAETAWMRLNATRLAPSRDTEMSKWMLDN